MELHRLSGLRAHCRHCNAVTGIADSGAGRAVGLRKILLLRWWLIVAWMVSSFSPRAYQAAAGKGYTLVSLDVFRFVAGTWLFYVFWCCAALPVLYRYVVKYAVRNLPNRYRFFAQSSPARLRPSAQAEGCGGSIGRLHRADYRTAPALEDRLRAVGGCGGGWAQRRTPRHACRPTVASRRHISKRSMQPDTPGSFPVSHAGTSSFVHSFSLADPVHVLNRSGRKFR